MFLISKCTKELNSGLCTSWRMPQPMATFNGFWALGICKLENRVTVGFISILIGWRMILYGFAPLCAFEARNQAGYFFDALLTAFLETHLLSWLKSGSFDSQKVTIQVQEFYGTLQYYCLQLNNLWYWLTKEEKIRKMIKSKQRALCMLLCFIRPTLGSHGLSLDFLSKESKGTYPRLSITDVSPHPVPL